MFQRIEERACTSHELSGFRYLVHTETPLDQVVGFHEQMSALFDVVHHIDIAILVTSIHEWKLDCASTVAAVESTARDALVLTYYPADGSFACNVLHTAFALLTSLLVKHGQAYMMKRVVPGAIGLINVLCNLSLRSQMVSKGALLDPRFCK